MGTLEPACLCDYKHAFGSGAAALLDTCGRPNAHTCCSVVLCCEETCQGVALMVPLKQQQMLGLLKSRLPGMLWVVVAATWAPGVLQDPGCNLSLPLILTIWTSPVSLRVTASKCLLRCLGILVKIPISCYCGCFGGKRVVLAQLPALTIWTLCPSCPIRHPC